MKKLLSIVVLAIIFVIVGIQPPALAADDGSKIFQRKCVGCHKGGMNRSKKEKTLKKSDLEKYGMFSAEKIIYQVTNGKKQMPAFGKRLKPQEIKDVAAYVMAQAEKGWPSNKHKKRRKR